MIDISIIISGSAGQGIQTVGYILAKTASKTGYNVFSWQEYESRIRGGSSSYLVRLNTSLTLFQVLDRLNTSFTIVVI